MPCSVRPGNSVKSASKIVESTGPREVKGEVYFNACSVVSSKIYLDLDDCLLFCFVSDISLVSGVMLCTFSVSDQYQGIERSYFRSVVVSGELGSGSSST